MMPVSRGVYQWTASWLMVIGLGGCSWANAIVEPSTSFHFVVSDAVNPDLDGRPSPLVVTYFELSSRTEFDHQGFFELVDQAEVRLGPDLLYRDEFEFQPGDATTFERRLNPNAHYVALVAGYRDIEQARWRLVIDVVPQHYDDITVNVEPLALYVQQ